MKRPAPLLLLSICLNVGLLVAAFWAYRTPTVLSPPVSEDGVVEIPLSQSSGLISSPVLQYATNQFRWSQIESTNYDDYVANLRSIGCPEKTLRDIILADVEKRYAERGRNLRINRTFWLAGNRRRIAERSSKQQSQALEQEKKQLLIRLLGPDAILSERLTGGDRFEEQALTRFLMGPVSEETFQRVVRTAEKYDALRSDIHERAQGILTDEDEAELRNLSFAGAAEFSNYMTPTELEEFAARAATIKSFFNQDAFFEIVSLSAIEFRQIALASAGDKPFAWFDLSDQATVAEQQEHEVLYKAKVAQLLGAERFADFERAQDGDFRQMFEVTKENELPKATAVKIYNIRKLVKEERERVRNDASLEESARRQLLEEMERETKRVVADALGGKAFQDYLNRGGAWVTNINSL